MEIQTNRPRALAAGDIKPRQRKSISALPAVTRLGSKLAESYSATLFGPSGASLRVTLDHIEESASAVSEDAATWFRLETRLGSMTLHLAFDRTAVSACCEAAMGGTGTEAPYEFPDRPLSGIEKGIVRLALKGLGSRTTAVFAEQLATPVSQFDGLVEPEESCGNKEQIVFRFLVNLFGYSGELCLAASSSEIAAQFETAGSEAGAIEARTEQLAALQRSIAKADITFSVMLGAETVLVEDLTNLAPGRLLQLSSSPKAPVLVWSEGNPVFIATLARTGGQLAVRIISAAE